MGIRVIHADSSLQYYGYYLSGFEPHFGPIPLSFGVHDLPRLASPQEGIAIELSTGRRIFISAADRPAINREALEWCDAYGMVNLDPSSKRSASGHKLVALGPGFGIRWRSRTWSARYVLRAAMAGGRTFASPLARWDAARRHWRDRLPLSAYTASSSDGSHADRPYLFAQATYWTNHPDINGQRVEAFDALRTHFGSSFDGGLVPNGASDLRPEQVRAPLPLAEFLARTTRSVAAINLPGVHRCLGWKLGEYLGLGKAIISSPVAHEMPGSFEHGEHLHVVDPGGEAWVEGVDRLANDRAYRHHLEHNARAYFDAWVSPRAAVARLLAHADEVAR